MIDLVHPLQGDQFQRFPGLPGALAVNQLGLVQPVDGFGQRVVMTVAPAAYRWSDAYLIQPFGVANADVLTACVGAEPGVGARAAWGVTPLNPGNWGIQMTNLRFSMSNTKNDIWALEHVEESSSRGGTTPYGQRSGGAMAQR